MKKKIFRSIFLTSFLSVVIFAITVSASVMVNEKRFAMVAFIIAFVIVSVAIYITAKMLSSSIMEPFNKLDLLGREPEYKEFEPIVRSMGKLSSRLDRYIDRLKNEKEKVMLITENMVEGMILLDENGEILSVNKSALELLNPYFELEEHMLLSSLTDKQEIIDAVTTADYDEKAYGEVEIKNRHLQIFVNKARFNNTHGFIILLVDASEKLKAEAIRKDFSANVSHELKTPLTTIKGFGELLEKGLFNDTESVKKFGGTIYRESERLLSLINDIIRLSEIEEHNKSEVMSQVNLLDTANEVEEILANKAQRHGISMSVEGENVTLLANASYMSELFLNLMDNAIKYNDEGGHVWVKIHKKNGLAYITVKDDGIGISAEHQDRIFERFYRVDKSRSKQTGGTGLGLSIVKHIATYHQGSISIQSEVGEGTQIEVSLPIYTC